MDANINRPWFTFTPAAGVVKRGGALVLGGKIGDGKIFITHLEECMRIRTGERGGDAI